MRVLRQTCLDLGVDVAGHGENVRTAIAIQIGHPGAPFDVAVLHREPDARRDVLVMNMNEPPSLLRNDYAGPNHWLEIRLEGTTSNRSAIGALVTVEANGRTTAHAVVSQSSYYSHDDLRLHFGLGAQPTADSIRIRWPSGSVETLANVRVDRVMTIREPTQPAR